MCRALSESEPKAKLELSAKESYTLNESNGDSGRTHIFHKIFVLLSHFSNTVLTDQTCKGGFSID